MASFSKYLPCQAMHFLQHSTHFSKTCCRPLITLKFLASELPFHGWKSTEITWEQDPNWILCLAWKKWIDGTPSEHPPYSPVLAPCNFWAFPTMKRELSDKKFRSDQRSAARFWEVGGVLQEVHQLPREVLQKRDHHHTSTNFWLGVIRPSYFRWYTRIDLFQQITYFTVLKWILLTYQYQNVCIRKVNTENYHKTPCKSKWIGSDIGDKGREKIFMSMQQNLL
jgi:hypothetical protein